MNKTLSLIVFFLLSFMVYSQDESEIDLGYELLEAAADSSMSKLMIALEKGADINFFDPYYQLSALHYACDRGHLEMVKYLIEEGAKVDSLTSKGHTPLLVAVERMNFEITEFLIRSGANINSQDQFSQSALHFAVYNFDLLLADLLLYYEISIDMQDYRGVTALNLAAMLDDYEMVELLYSNGASIEIEDNLSYTPLMNAILYGAQYSTASLLDLGADTKKLTSNDFDAFQIACESGNVEIASWLMNDSLDVNRKIGTLTLYDRTKIFHNHIARKYLKEQEAKRFSGFYFNHYEIAWENSFNLQDYFMGARVGIQENYSNLVFSLSYGSRLRREAIHNTFENEFYQFWENRHFLALQVEKKFDVIALNQATSGFYVSAKEMFTWGSWEATDRRPKAQFVLAPAAGWFIENYYVGFRLGLENYQFNSGEFSPWRIQFGLSFYLPKTIPKLKYHQD